MPNEIIIEAKQVRSQQTQQKLLNALSACLKNQFFEHISIAQLTEQAGVSVGTFYRRFKNKEALLPLLYQDFGVQFIKWVESLEQSVQANLNVQVEQLVTECCKFLQENAGVLRTLHLNARLYPEILPASQLNERSSEYQRLSAILAQHKNEINHTNVKVACDMAIFMTVSNLIEKILYKELTPAIASPISISANRKELTLMIQRYLSSN